MSGTKGWGLSRDQYSVLCPTAEGFCGILVAAVWVMLNRSTKAMGQGRAGKESKVHSGTLHTSVRGESGPMFRGRMLVFSLPILPSKSNAKPGVGNHEQAFSGRHYTITAYWLSAAVRTFFSKQTWSSQRVTLV